MKLATQKTMILALAAAMSACNAPIGALFSPAISLVTPNPNATPTPTPFGPLMPTGAPSNTALDVIRSTPVPETSEEDVIWAGFPGPAEPSATEIPPPMEPIDFDPSVVNIIMLGSDYRAYTGGWRTDTMMIVSLDPKKGTATLLSIPRDLYVYIPGWRVDRINTADVRGGPEMVATAILYNLGIPIHHWARVKFDGFTKAIDLLGGVDVEVPRAIKDECEEGKALVSIPAGIQHMNGYKALCYVRMRKRSSDFDRLRRQQEVVQAIFDKVLSLNGLSRVPELYEEFDDYVETSVKLEDVLPLVPLAATVASDRSRIRRYAIDSNRVESWRVPYSGAAVLLPDREAIQELLDTAFGP